MTFFIGIDISFKLNYICFHDHEDLYFIA